MKVYTILPKGFASNTYVVTENGKDAILIDCAQERVYEECVKLGLTPKAVLLTHGHYDHIGGCGVCYENGCDIYCGESEDEVIYGNANRAIFHDITIPHFKLKELLCDGQTISLYGCTFQVYATPGHTQGGVCYRSGDVLFTGDTLFFESVGRTDLETGNLTQLEKSVQKLYELEGNPKVYCGHGMPTYLDHERQYNPYIRKRK